MSEFTRTLEYIFADDKEKDKLLNSSSFKSEIGTEKQLLISESSDSSELLESTILNAIIDGAKEKESMRNVLPIINTNDTYQAKISYGTSPTTIAEYVSEGTDIPINTEDYSVSTIEINKAATRPMITKEMIEDSRFGLIELELKKAGARLENKLNQEVITTLLDDHNGSSPSDTDPAGTHLALSDIGLAYADLSDLGWKPNKLVLHPQAAGYMQSGMGFSVNPNKGELWNMETYILDSSTDDGATSSWADNDSANNYTGIMLDSTNYGAILMKDDISVERFDDPIHDLVGLTVSMRFGVGVMNDTAAIRILAK